MIETKLIITANKLISPRKAVDVLMRKTVPMVNVIVGRAEKKFNTMVKGDLNWHSWRGGVGGSLGTFSTKSTRIAESKRSGYLSTGVPSYAVPAGKDSIVFGFGDRSKILNILTRDGKQNLADLLEYGAKPHNIPLSDGDIKTYTAMNNHGKLFIWRKQAAHKGFVGKYFYTRTLLYLQEKLGLVSVGVRNNWTIYVQDAASGRIVNNFPAIVAKLDGRI